MTQRDDGGPAFPFVLQGPKISGDSEGMSLRDWFAGMALSAVIQHCDRERWEWAARRAYDVADAMLSERAKEKP